MNKFYLNKYGYSLSWDVSLIKDSNLTKTKESRSVQLSEMAIESIDYLIGVSKSKYIILNFTGSKSFFCILNL